MRRMKTDTLGSLFGSMGKVRIIRLFLFNPKSAFTVADIASRSQVRPEEVCRELTSLHAAKLVHRTSGKKTKYTLDERSPYTAALQNLLLNLPLREGELHKRLEGMAGLKLLVLAGIFAGNMDARLDMLLVGDRINERRIRTSMRRLEADMGREIRYTMLSVQDFRYRLNISDRLTRDIFDYPHRIVLDKLDIGLK